MSIPVLSTPVLRALSLLLSAGILMAGCAGSPPPPDWKLNAVSLLEHYQARWLEGDTRAADLALRKAREEISKTGRLDLLARLELAACGTRISSLDFSECAAFSKLQGDAVPPDQHYAQFLSGNWQGLDTQQIDTAYQGVLAAKDDNSANQAALAIPPPLPRLIAAGVLLRQGRANPATLANAVDTASAQGWRRPLLTWLEVVHQQALSGGDIKAAQQVQRRIEFVRGNPL